MITLDQLPARHPGRRLLTGSTPWFAYQGDLRFSYRTYVPHDGEHLDTARVLVLVHGTSRDTPEDWVAFAEQHNVVVIQPLFPVGIDGPDDIDGYKTIDSGTVRYDQVLFGILDEVAKRWGVHTERFVLAGHSGGGQFTLRMLLLHPQRLGGVVVSAPGRITLVDAGSAWPLGTADVAKRFGVDVDPTQIARVPVLLVIGAEDHGTADLAAQGDAAQDQFGTTRRERLETISRHLHEIGAHPIVTVIPGVGHENRDWEQHAQKFAADELVRTDPEGGRAMNTIQHTEGTVTWIDTESTADAVLAVEGPLEPESVATTSKSLRQLAAIRRSAVKPGAQAANSIHARRQTSTGASVTRPRNG